MPLLAEKSRLGQKVVVRRMRRRRNNLSRGLRWGNRKRSRRSSYGRVLYNYFRDYDSQTGRYLESDPIGLEGGLNTYGYALQNPLGFIDPLGLDAGCGFGRRPAPAPGNESSFPQVYICVGNSPIEASKGPGECVTAECAAGILPNPRYSQETLCNLECNIKPQIVCTGIGIAAGSIFTPATGVAAGGTCIVVKATVCAVVCDDDDIEQCE